MSLFDLKELRGINGWPNSNSMHVDRSGSDVTAIEGETTQLGNEVT